MAFESAIVSLSVQRIGYLLMEEAMFLLGVEDQVQSLRRQLQCMQSYLIDIDSQQEEGDERLRTQIKEIRKIVYAAEDVIESFILEVAPRRRVNLLKRYICCCKFLVRTHQIGVEIEAIKMRIVETSEMLQRYHVGVRTERMHKRRPRSYPSSHDDCVVGLDEDITRLAERLTRVKNQANILCIVGMGGCGKTTLARKLYHHESVKQHFHCRAWVSITQEWDAQHVLLEILRQTSGERQRLGESWSSEELVEKLCSSLQGKTYLIVLDDIWKKEALEDMLPAFPYGNEGSKIIVTTRNKEVIQFPNLPSYVHEPRRLTEDEAWELFSKIALSHKQGSIRLSYVASFEKLGTEMLKKCDGLPLAIIALGGLLGVKNTPQEWEAVSKAVSSKVMEGRGTHLYGKVKDMLALSYQDLPYDLKPCFLYLGLFPEDCEIPTGMLTRMWIAEGFIASQQLCEEETLEETARRRLEELVQRCMVQVAVRNYLGKVKAIRLHDLMRDLCIRKAKQEDFIDIFCNRPSLAIRPSVLGGDATVMQSRRTTIHCYSREFIALPTQSSRPRSLLIFGQANVGIHKNHTRQSRAKLRMELVYKKFRLIRVLNLVGIDTPDCTLPTQIGNLVHLRYLGLRTTNIRKLPRSIGNLKNLLTFDYRGVHEYDNNHIRVPNVFRKMERLRHLYLPRDMETMEGLELQELKNLQTLWVEDGGKWVLREMSSLSPSIQKLHIGGIRSSEQLEAVLQCPSIISDHIHKLHLDWSSAEIEMKILERISCCKRLYKLGLRGRIRDKLRPIQFAPNLTRLELWFTEFEEQDTMAALGKLPNLKILQLSHNSYVGTEWICSPGEFPKLEMLECLHLPNFETWTVERGAMHLLKKVSIRQCEKLSRLPHGLRFIETLEGLEIQSMPHAFCSRLQQATNAEKTGEGGEDLNIIQHIPVVRIL